MPTNELIETLSKEYVDALRAYAAAKRFGSALEEKEAFLEVGYTYQSLYNTIEKSLDSGNQYLRK